MSNKNFYIKKHSSELIEKLKQLGYRYCKQYDNTCDCLHVRTMYEPYFVDEHYEDLNSDNPYDGIDCGEDEELFLKLASKININEIEVGAKFQCGLIKLKCVKTVDKTCEGCFFNSPMYECDNNEYFMGSCLSDKRNDKNNVIYIRI